MTQVPESKQQTVERLYGQGCGKAEIALRMGISRKDVNRCISDMRRKAGGGTTIIIERVADYALYNHRKAVTGARKALEAMRA